MRDDRFLGQNLFDGPNIARRTRQLSRIYLDEDKLLGQLRHRDQPGRGSLEEV